MLEVEGCFLHFVSETKISLPLELVFIEWPAELRSDSHSRERTTDFMISPRTQRFSGEQAFLLSLWATACPVGLLVL